MMARQPIAGEVLQALAQVPVSGCGALVRARADGSLAGALLTERGRVCWAMSQRYPLHLTDILVEEQDTLTHDQLDELFAMCRRDQLPLGETLVARGLVSLPILHRALLRHTCEALDCLIRDEASPWSWVEHAGYGYHPMLTFSPVEVITGVRALANPALTARAQARLAALVRPGQRGFAVARTRGAKVPLAQLGCEAIALDTLTDLAVHADEVMAVAATVSIEVALAELGDLACASWTEDGLLFVLLCEGELAFNRLLAQVATMTINP
jgi:hypothetical protein